MTTNRTFRTVAKLALAGAISVVGLTAAGTAARQPPAPTATSSSRSPA